MVRVKTRWIVCRVEFERNILLKDERPDEAAAPYFPSKKELAGAIRETILSSFGDSGGSAASSSVTQGTIKYLI